MTDPDRLLLRAIRVSVFSVAWSLVVGGSASAVAILTRSPSLAGFGLDAVADGAASIALIWYFKARVRDLARADRLERMTLRSVGAALLAAAGYVAIRSISLLIERASPEVSALGIAISAASTAVLPAVALVKLRLAARIPSAALRSDGVLTAGAAFLALISLIATSLQGRNGFWWVDSAAALVIAAMLAAEGARALIAEA